MRYGGRRYNRRIAENISWNPKRMVLLSKFEFPNTGYNPRFEQNEDEQKDSQANDFCQKKCKRYNSFLCRFRNLHDSVALACVSCFLHKPPYYYYNARATPRRYQR